MLLGLGKLDQILRDPSVTVIECNGPSQNLSIVRAGQKQFTKISLNSIEIKEFLEKSATKAHVPLLEGVFKVAVDNYIVNAVVSSVIGSRFILKKHRVAQYRELIATQIIKNL